MKTLSISLMILLSCVSFYAQDKKESSADETVIDFSVLQNDDPDCGESNGFTVRKGKVTKIINGNSFIFAVDDEFEKETYQVILAGIDTSSNSSALKKLLIENFLNQKVSVTGEESKEGSKKIIGIVNPYAPNKIGEPNLYFLKNGLAKYVEPKRKLVPNYILCRYRKIAKQAKEAKIGIWAK